MVARIVVANVLVIVTSLLACQAIGVVRAGPPIQPCVDDVPGGGHLQFKGYGTSTHVVTRDGAICPNGSEAWTFSTVGQPFDQAIRVEVVVISGSITASLRPPSGDPLVLEPGLPVRAETYGGSYTYEIDVNGAGDGLATYQLRVCRALAGADPCTFSEGVTANHGDVNCTGTVNSLDALLILQFVAGLLADLPCQSLAETNPPAGIDPADAQGVLQMEAGLLESFWYL